MICQTAALDNVGIADGSVYQTANIKLQSDQTAVILQCRRQCIVAVIVGCSRERQAVRFKNVARNSHRFHSQIGVIAVNLHRCAESALGSRGVSYRENGSLARFDCQRQRGQRLVSVRQECNVVYHHRSAARVADAVVGSRLLGQRAIAKRQIVVAAESRTLYVDRPLLGRRCHILHRDIAQHHIFRSQIIVAAAAVKFHVKREQIAVIACKRGVVGRIGDNLQLFAVDICRCGMVDTSGGNLGAPGLVNKRVWQRKLTLRRHNRFHIVHLQRHGDHLVR